MLEIQDYITYRRCAFTDGLLTKRKKIYINILKNYGEVTFGKSLQFKLKKFFILGLKYIFHVTNARVTGLIKYASHGLTTLIRYSPNRSNKNVH